MAFFFHDATSWERVAKCANLTGGAAGRWLTSQAGRSVAWLAEVTREEVDTVNQSVDCGASGVLVHAHAPE